MNRAHLSLLLGITLCVAAPAVHAQRDEGVMSEAEIDKLREAAYFPIDRIHVFIKLIDVRTQKIQDLVSKPRHPGHEQELHDLLDQVSAIAGELNDNLDDYSAKHRDLRKALPKLLEASERWATAVRAPGDDPAYKVVRRMALDSIDALHKAADDLKTQQTAYFAAHPDAAKADQQRTDGQIRPDAPVTIPR